MISTQAFNVPFSNESEYMNRVFGAPAGVHNGKSGGVTFLLNAATYDYMYHAHASEGFTIALNHHNDLPIVRQTGINVMPGTEVVIQISSTLYTTTEVSRPVVVNLVSTSFG